METLTVILLALTALSEVLALIPALKSNSIFQLICNLLSRLNFRGGS